MPTRLLAITAAAILLAAPATQAAPLGPDIAVMNIQIGNDRRNPKRVVIGLYDTTAPATVENFKKLSQRNFYRGIRFHRVLPDTLVQTGDPFSRMHRLHSVFTDPQPARAGTGGPGYTLPAEIRAKPVRGSVAMGRLPDAINPLRASNGSQFFILLAPNPALDGRYTVFGEVLEGLDVIEEISRTPTNNNDFPLQNIFIRSIMINPRSEAENSRR